jgi:O-methyltransferase
MLSIFKNFLLKLYFKRVQLMFKNFTMIPSDIYISNLRLAFTYRKTEGIIVECGVWRGGMIAGMAQIMDVNKQYYLFDSFEGLPDAEEIDGKAALEWQNNKSSEHYYDNCKAEIEYANSAMKLAGANNYQLIKGWFNETLPNFNPKEKIAILRLDADWYESTMTCLNYLYPLVSENGLIIIDDYHAWDGCSRAVHDYLSKNNLPLRISQTEAGICYIVNIKNGRKL